MVSTPTFDIVDGGFSLAQPEAYLAANAEDIDATWAKMVVARAEERRRWAAAGEFAQKVPQRQTM